MSTERNYWVFRSKWREQECIERNVIIYEWNVDFSQGLDKLTEEQKQQVNNSSSRQWGPIRNYASIKKGDIVVLPRKWGGVAVGETTSEALYDGRNYFKVNWLCEWYDRKDLPSGLQGRGLGMATFKNLWRYKEKLERLIESKFKGLSAKVQEKQLEHAKEITSKIANHINKAKNMSFGDKEFEDFVMDLFELHYPGLQTEKNNPRREKHDGRDFTGAIVYEELGIYFQMHVQVKQHEGPANWHGIDQIAKSDAEGDYDRNILVTTGRADEAMKKEAKKRDIVLIDCEELATMIWENFEDIEEKWKAKLGLISSVATV